MTNSIAPTAGSAWLLLGAALTLALQAAEPPRASAPAASKSDAASGGALAQIDNLVRYAMPNEHHKLINPMAGHWTTVTRYWMQPGTEPAEANGTSTRKWILGGRFLLEELDGGDLALPFQGLALYGYDAFERQYTSAWVDSMSTAILSNLGTYDKTNDLVRFTGYYKDPWSGQKLKNRGLLRFQGPDRQVLELHVTRPNGREFKMLEITYTRAKPPAGSKESE